MGITRWAPENATCNRCGMRGQRCEMAIKRGRPASLWRYTLVLICHWRGADGIDIEEYWASRHTG